MPKIDITVGKKFTLNTQNFSSISPTVTITLHDLIDTEDIIKVHDLLDIVTDAMLHKQIESDAKTMAVIKKIGFSKYFKLVEENGDMDKVLKDSVKELSELPPF